MFEVISAKEINEVSSTKEIMKREDVGKFTKGNKEGRKFQKGEGGKN